MADAAIAGTATATATGPAASPPAQTAVGDAPLRQLPEKLQNLTRPVVVTGTVIGDTPEGLTRIRTAAGEIQVQSPAPLPADRPVTLQIPAGSPPASALLLAQTPPQQPAAAPPATGPQAQPPTTAPQPTPAAAPAGQAGQTGAPPTATTPVLTDIATAQAAVPAANTPLLTVGTVLPALVLAINPRPAPSGPAATGSSDAGGHPTPSTNGDGASSDATVGKDGDSQGDGKTGAAGSATGRPSTAPTGAAAMLGKGVNLGGDAAHRGTLADPPASTPGSTTPAPDGGKTTPSPNNPPPTGTPQAGTPQPEQPQPAPGQPRQPQPGQEQPEQARAGNPAPKPLPDGTLDPNGRRAPQQQPQQATPQQPSPPGPGSGAAPQAQLRPAEALRTPGLSAAPAPAPAAAPPPAPSPAPQPGQAAPSPPQPRPQGAPPPMPEPQLRPGQMLALKVLSVTPPSQQVQPPPTTTPPPPAPSPAGNGNPSIGHPPLEGVVAGATPQGKPVVALRDGMLALNTDRTLPPGTRLTLEFANPAGLLRAPGLEAAASLPDYLQGNDWSGLRQILAALRDIDPALVHNLLGAAMPQPGKKLGATMAFLISAMRGGDARGWLGADATQALASRGKEELVETLRREIRDKDVQHKERLPDDWQGVTLPMYDQSGINPMHIAYMPLPPVQDEQDGGKGGGQKGCRFVLDVDLSRLGPLQLDGLVKTPRFDLVLRSRTALTVELRQELRDVFANCLDIMGYAGGITFQSDMRSWVRLTRTGSTAPGIRA